MVWVWDPVLQARGLLVDTLKSLIFRKPTKLVVVVWSHPDPRQSTCSGLERPVHTCLNSLPAAVIRKVTHSQYAMCYVVSDARRSSMKIAIFEAKPLDFSARPIFRKNH